MISRRQALSLLPASSVLGANGRIGLALIGCGDRGIKALLREVLKHREAANVEVRAVCDVWKQHREQAAAEVRTANAGPGEQFTDYRAVLDRKDIDAVLIATPDHQHATMLTHALQAGKDAYVEKPLAMEMKELLRCYDTARSSKRIIQMGTQIRSLPSSMAARAFVTGGGIGPVVKVEQVRNSLRPYWWNYAERPIAESDTDWRAFVFNRKPRPWNARQHAGWYGFREFSRGPHSNLMVHFIDLVHHVTGCGLPKSCVTLAGTWRWKADFTAPDSVETILEYDEFLVRYSSAFGTGHGNYLKFFGRKAALDASNWSGKPFTLLPQGAEEPLPADAAIPERQSDPHMLNWLKCLRSRQTPNAPVEAGFSHSIAVILSDESLVRRRRLLYDPQSRAIKPA